MSNQSNRGAGAPARKCMLGGASAGALATAMTMLALSAPAYAQEAGDEEIVVTGFRGSLANALNLKRDQVGVVDVIVAEDIADFPDLNLAEAIQRVPGVSIDRDAGEGRQITIRGLDAQFTRVRVNGMESISTTGATDSSAAAGNVGSGTNRSRGFDFNVFASDLFNSITVRKTASAAVEEGSLGATVDLVTARPFDFDGFALAMSGQAGYNDLSETVNPRVAFLISNRFGDNFGVLLSAAFSHRDLLEEGPSTVRWQNNLGSAANNFGPLGPTYAGSGSTPTLAQINAAFHPRIPRYDILEHSQDRLGATLSLQYQPTDAARLSFDVLYAKMDSTRYEYYLEAPSFSTGGASGINDTNPNAAAIDAGNTLVYGNFDDVDVRTEARYDELTTEFLQYTLNAEVDLTDRLRWTAIAGRAASDFENPIQTTLTLDAINVDGYVYDYRQDDRLPLISYGTLNPNNPASWTLSQIRLRPQTASNVVKNVATELAFEATSSLTLRGGASWKFYDFRTTEMRRSNGTTGNREGVIPAAIAATPFADYAMTVSLHGGLDFPAGTMTSWLVPDLSQAASLFSLYSPTAFAGAFAMGPEPSLNNNRSVEETDTGAFLQADLDTTLFGAPFRGDIGVRYAETEQSSTGYQAIGTTNVLTTVERGYSDTLPSVNLSLEPVDDVVIRFGAARVMARPNISLLTPGGSVAVSGSNRTVTVGNPLLEPFRADTIDFGVEWYFATEALLSFGWFSKDLGTFVQSVSSTRAFTGNPYGIPDAVATAACGSPPAAGCSAGADWVFTASENTSGGKLTGFEISYQQPLSFLPSPFDDLGVIFNYTNVDSTIEYLDPSLPPPSPGVVALREESLIGLSPSAYNATIYYENETFSARVSASYRDRYLSNVPGRNLNTVEGKNESINIDASASWAFNERLKFTMEALNLTDEVSDQFLDDVDRSFVYHHTGREVYLGLRYRY